MAPDYSKLVPGQEISRHSYQLDETLVSDYVAAVQDQSPLSNGNTEARLVPAMAVAALSIRGVVQDLGIPGGTLHVGQEFQFLSVVSIGESLHCVATLAQNSIRGEWRFLVVDCHVASGDCTDVMTGKSTIMIPLAHGPCQVAS